MNLPFASSTHGDAASAARPSELALLDDAPPPASITPQKGQASTPAAATGVTRSPTTSRGRLPWLILAAGLLLGGMAGWYAWQFRMLGAPATMPSLATRSHAAPVTPEAPPPVRTAPARSDSPSASTPPASTPMHPAKRRAMQHRPASTPPRPDRAQKTVLDSAWLTYRNGDLPRAALLYRQQLQQDPDNRDAMLGLAAVSARLGDRPQALDLYQRLLARNPHDDDARTGQFLLEPHTLDPQTEAQLLHTQSGAAPRILGGYYASQQRWAEARQQYGIACRQNPDDADLTFNLAVSLDHLRQTREASHYYRRALSLKNRHFSQQTARQRLSELTAVRP